VSHRPERFQALQFAGDALPCTDVPTCLTPLRPTRAPGRHLMWLHSKLRTACLAHVGVLSPPARGMPVALHTRAGRTRTHLSAV
jgi:hypothetical protein